MINYGAHSVLEYYIIDPDNETIEEYYLKDKKAKEYFPVTTQTILDATLTQISH